MTLFKCSILCTKARRTSWCSSRLLELTCHEPTQARCSIFCFIHSFALFTLDLSFLQNLSLFPLVLVQIGAAMVVCVIIYRQCKAVHICKPASGNVYILLLYSNRTKLYSFLLKLGTVVLLYSGFAGSGLAHSHNLSDKN